MATGAASSSFGEIAAFDERQADLEVAEVMERRKFGRLCTCGTGWPSMMARMGHLLPVSGTPQA
jgi:hypothetical protein